MATLGTWVVGTVVLAIVLLAAGKVYRDKKNGAGCGSGCDGCSKCPGGMK